MFNKTIRKKLVNHFAIPVRYRQLPKLADDIISITNYSIVRNFCNELKKEKIIKPFTLKAKNNKYITLYTSSSLGDLNPYTVAMSMHPDGYFCNLASIYYHSLTNQIPKSIYVCNETIFVKKRFKKKVLSNSTLRSAFIKPHRYTENTYQFNKYDIIVVNRAINSDYGVEIVHNSNKFCPLNSRITCIERALIDAVISPHYNGGIVSVYSYFNNARRKLSINKLIKIYKQMSLVYPYYQTIGFFLDRTGMHKQASAIYETFVPKHVFFVDHNAKASWKYDEKWKLYYPNGLVDEDR